ncbi:hypothetical protein G6F22_017634 [Rhizopus arrhizus]|nr:hypothetical protein G6F22_017634 [Rhizopus arrhizus]
MDHPVDEQEAQHEHPQREVIHVRVHAQVHQAQELAAGDTLHAVLAPRPAYLHRHEVRHLRQRQRDHREIDAGAPDGQPADRIADGGGHGHAAKHGDFGWQAARAEQDHHFAGGVSGPAEERRVAERHQARETRQQVEGQRKQRKAQHLHHEHGVDDLGEEGHQQRGYKEQRQDADRKGNARHLISPCRTSRPGASATRWPSR